MAESGAPLTAFLGATGGCGIAALSKTLKAGNKAIARKHLAQNEIILTDIQSVVRTPSKLVDMLKAEPHSIAESTIQANLTTLAGSATDPAAVKQLFDHPIDVVLFAIGGSPQFKASLTEPVVNDQPTLCGDAMVETADWVSTN
jgi:hypothetical protein